MSSNTHKMFADYEMRVHIELRRKIDRWNSDTLADVQAEENLAIAERDVQVMFVGFVTEALHKAENALDIKRTFERDMMALEAGTDYDA